MSCLLMDLVIFLTLNSHSLELYLWEFMETWVLIVFLQRGLYLFFCQMPGSTTNLKLFQPKCLTSFYPGSVGSNSKPIWVSLWLEISKEASLSLSVPLKTKTKIGTSYYFSLLGRLFPLFAYQEYQAFWISSLFGAEVSELPPPYQTSCL